MKTRTIKLTRLITVATVILGITWSCQQDEELNLQTEETVFLSELDMEGMTKLGNKLENPYSVANMRLALGSLIASNSNGRVNGEEVEITTTHLYVRFKPKDEEELAILKRDSTLILYEYPLDYEIEEGGVFYHDPLIPVGTPTFQYSSIPIEKELPESVEYELLEELFIPDDFSDVSNIRFATDYFIEALVAEALRITGNLEEDSQSNKGRVQASSWRPAGTIRVWDNSISPNNWRGVEGVEVKARRWFTTHKGKTKSSGYYSCDGAFKRDANYSLDWERYDFALREGWLDGANINGPKKEGNWNQDFNSGKSMFHARVFMAAYHYYYKDIKALRKPPQNGVLKTQMHIRYYIEDNDESNGNHKEERRFLGLGSQIKIYNPNRSMNQIYATTVHELAHASHWNMWRNGDDFDDSESKVKESWARGVQWELTRMVWSDYRTPSGPLPKYTLLVVDMIDPNYPSNSFTDNLTNGLWNDNVTGYTLRQIEDALQGKKKWNDWRDNIKNKYNNATENNLDALFAYWN